MQARYFSNNSCDNLLILREYIERGLRGVEQEVKSGGGGGIPQPTASRGSVLSDSNTSSQPAHMVYLERLKRFIYFVMTDLILNKSISYATLFGDYIIFHVLN